MKIKCLIILSVLCSCLFTFSSCSKDNDSESFDKGDIGGGGDPPRAMRINDVLPVLQSDSLVSKTIESE